MSTDEGSNSEQAAPTPILNNLLSKSGPGSEAPGQETTAQNGTGSQPPQSGDQPPPQQPQQMMQQPQHMQQLPPPGHHPGYAPYPGHWPPGRPPGGYPGYPPGPGGWQGHPGHPGGQYPQYMMRPPMAPGGQGELVRMPPGPGPLEWSAQQKKLAENQHGTPGTPASQPAPSPAASSVGPEESNDDKSRLDSPSWAKGPPGQSGPMGMPPHPGMMMAPHPGMMPPPQGPHMPPMMGQPMMPPGPPTPQAGGGGGGPKGSESILEKLVGKPCEANPPRVMPERRAFFQRLVAICEQHGDPITMVPQVSKQQVDLHRLYIAVRNKGGFEQVTKEKLWKSMCAETNPEISESSAAGYQLRKHYQRHLLTLECLETGKSIDEAVAFADKQKRQRTRKEGQTPQPGTPGAGAPPTAPSTSGGFPEGYPGPPPPGGYPGYPPGYPGHPGMPPPGPMGYPQGYPPRAMPGVTPMRAPQPQPHMMPQGVPQPAQEEAQQAQNLLQVPQQQAQPATPGSQAGGPASVQQPSTPAPAQENSSQAGSRAPSAGPAVGSATPDSTSRMSANNEGGETRPESQAAATPRAVATPTPGAPPAQPPQQQMPPGHPMHMPPSTSMAAVQPGGPPPPGHGYYGQPAPMYPNGAPRPGPHGYPPPHGYPQGYPPHPGGPPGMPPNQYSQPHPASHPNHPHHQQYMMWQRQYPQQPGGPRPMPNQAPYGYPPRIQPPPQQPMPQGAASPGGNKMRYPPSSMPQQPAMPQQYSTPQGPQQPRPPQNMPQYQPQPQQQATPQQMQPTPQQQPLPTAVHYPSGHGFPPATIEATNISQVRRKRPMARDLILATPRRLVMSLRSGLETEAIWSLNALNVLLYDDSNSHPSLHQMPGMLNVLIEHFWATLSLLFPEHFPLSAKNIRKVNGVNEAKTLNELMKESERLEVKPIVTTRDKERKNYTKISRAGRKVHLKEVEMPEILKRQLMEEEGTSSDDAITCEYIEERLQMGLGGGLAERVAERLKVGMEIQKAIKPPVFSKAQGKSIWGEEDFPIESEMPKPVKEEEDEWPELLIHRRPKSYELKDSPTDFEMKWPKPTALTDRDEVQYHLAMRALSISNVLRGFSFLPGNEHQLSRHHGLLYIIGRLLTLFSEEKPVVRNPPKRPSPDDPVPGSEPFHEVRRKALAIVNAYDNQELLILDTSNQLRDDAFVMLCHLSPYLDLWDKPSDLSYPIYDGILKWATSPVPEAIEPIPPAVTSLRNYCFEIMCKMSVFERNIDMILATGPWPRLEKLARSLVKLTTLGEATENREFAIVILSAFCLASEPMTYIASAETELINHLISFIEYHDQAMHQVMQNHGMATLRDNPELMGTSIGMLRRAATLLKHFSKIPETRTIYLRNTARLLQFTMSQLMDSRVAGYVAELLFEIQGTLFTDPEKPKITGDSEEKPDENNDAKKVIKTEVNEEQNGNTSPAASESSSCENTMTSEKSEEKECNGNSDSKKSSKRKNSGEASPPSKRNCLENGFPEKKNGKLDKPIQLKESRTENSSSMAVVA